MPIAAKVEDFEDFKDCSRPELLRALAVQRQDLLKRRAFAVAAVALLKEVDFAVTCGHDPSRRVREQALQLVDGIDVELDLFGGIDAELDLFDGAVGLQL